VYGLGGIGNSLQEGRLSDIKHKKHLLMYYDKRFQQDPFFPLISFNHEQIKEATTAGYLLAEKSKFENISKRLMDLDLSVLTDISKKMEDGSWTKPETDEEKLCFQLIKDLDHVGGSVKGSVTSKKYMRNEIWSLISFAGAPSWFITLAPADIKHPISLYFADTKETFQPEFRSHDERYRLIAHNPVAGARFFHFIVEIFIKHVLGVNTKHPGLYGQTKAYYGTVEQQGRLTLHLHLLLWIVGSLSPQEIRERIMDPTSEFQQKIVEYLESVHVGEFLTGSMNDIKSQVAKDKLEDQNYQNPTETLPDVPPPLCSTPEDNCSNCQHLKSWWNQFRYTVDRLIFHSNVHNCYRNENSSKKDRPTCINRYGNCKARFPRQVYTQTEVDPNTGALNIKKGEAWINTLTPVLTYLLRCNTDVTSLLSGTAIKAIVAYVSDYITKPGLKTYSIFDAVKGVFSQSNEMLGGSLTRKEKARKLIIKIVNSLTAKLEIGGPMASLYLLQNPDHYKSHEFKTVYWKSYVHEVLNYWKSLEDMKIDDSPEKLMVQRNKFGYIGVSPIYDYIYRPKIYNDKTLYEWIQMARRIKKPTRKDNNNDKDLNSLIDKITIESNDIDTSLDNCGDYMQDFSDVDDDIDEVESIPDIDSDVDDSSNDEADSMEVDDESDTEMIVDQDVDAQMFLKDHPLYQTHIIHFDKRKKYIVPNFVGGSLPRRDQGDREYYCATMLTLFKPWRSGKDLKAVDYSWDETFTNHVFTSDQLQKMNYFNLRYECNDARDDFSSQLKQSNNGINGLSHFMSVDSILEVDQDGQGDDFVYEDIDFNDFNINKYTSFGPYRMRIKGEMDAAENSVRGAGWMDESPDGLDQIERNPLKLDMQTATQWKQAVKDQREIVLAKRNKYIFPKQSKSKNYKDPNENNIKIIDQAYLRYDFKAKTKEAQDLINTTVKNFGLNKEQERAFRIVANHAVSPQSEQLKMYLGGMGGTGKSQVIKSLKKFFEQQNEPHRFVMLGPTGTSSALLGGSTYHSFLGIHVNDGRNEHTTIAQVKSKLEGVDYIFIDEVSMLSCHDLYKISAQLAKALNMSEIPFGGINIIFAGDFAQLPPVGGTALYNQLQVDSSIKLYQQEAVAGRTESAYCNL
jgi:hypothetical protein